MIQRWLFVDFLMIVLCFFFQDSHKLLSDGDGQVHVHLTVENLAGCFFNFGSADAGTFPFTPNPEAANSKKSISPKLKSVLPKS